MFDLSKLPIERNTLKTARAEALKTLIALDVSDPEYAPTLEKVETLSKLIAAEQREKLNVNTILLVAANLIGIAKIVRFEDEHVVTSKALPLVKKLL